ncbi:unnamed protein product [Echinostoma caproni]|uniref:Cyclic nucleotide-binding domain-containing protein n=1 Tax=Echinostoma caproni TaxID=27848 RepID=A0A183A2H0_9TREM|nr:unnamed protein product [Echinostoma caproni]
MPPSDTLIHTGDLLTAVYYVVKGSLEVVTTDDLILGVLNPGDFFGGLPTLVMRTPADRMHFYPCECALLPPTTTAGGAPPGGVWPTSTLALGMTAQHNPPPKSRFAVRALTYADVQFIDRHDLVDLCAVYPELPNRILERFELTIPLASSATGMHSTAKVTASWFSARSTLETFLTTCAAWNAVPAAVLSTTVPLSMRRPSRVDGMGYAFSKMSEIFSPSRPIWELERLQRLFDHGTLCSSNADTPAVHPYTGSVHNPAGGGHGTHLYGGVFQRSSPVTTSAVPNRTDREGTGTTLTNTTTNTTSMSPSHGASVFPADRPSPQDRRMRMLQGRPRSPYDSRNLGPQQSHSTPTGMLQPPNHDQFNNPEPARPLSDVDTRIMQLLIARFARVER